MSFFLLYWNFASVAASKNTNYTTLSNVFPTKSFTLNVILVLKYLPKQVYKVSIHIILLTTEWRSG